MEWDALCAFFNFLFLWFTPKAAPIHLEAYNVDPASVTVSGFSSGAAMATQLHVALSSTVHGAAVFSGMPYYCAHGIWDKMYLCMDEPSGILLSELIQETDKYESLDFIHASSNLSGSKVFIFGGKLDTVVKQGTVRKVQEFYEHYGADVTTEYSLDAEHCMPTNFYGPRCDFTGDHEHDDEFISNCAYDGAYVALNTLYGDIVQATGKEPLLGLFEEFNQSDFFATSSSSISSLDDVGFVYVPSRCIDKTKKCRLHIALHGCTQGRYRLDDAFARKTGYLQVAELNDVIVIFPQANIIDGRNPYGCWDWWGFTGPKYATRYGEQIVAIRKMIETVLGREVTSDQRRPAAE